MDDNLLSKKKLLFNQGSNFFRQRLVLSLLSARPINITDIRSKSDFAVGVTEYEVSFIHLLDKVSNGSRFKISDTGTEVSLIPGTLLGGPITHSCHTSRPLSYYLEPILLLAPFCKKPLQLSLKGQLQNDLVGYNSLYKLKYAALPLMEMFGVEVDVQVKSRGFEDSEVLFTSTVKKQLLTLRSQLNQDCGKVKKVRGLAYGFRVSPQMLNRIITSAKGVFLPFINDVFITNDPVKHSKSKVPGYGVILYAETTKGITYAEDGFVSKKDVEKLQESVDHPSQLWNLDLDKVSTGNKRDFDLFPEDDEQEDEVSEGGPERKKAKKSLKNLEDADMASKAGMITPEEIGERVAKQLLREIFAQSRVDSVYQWLVLGFMALGPKDVTSIIVGSLTPFTVQFLRDVKTFFGVTFQVQDYKEKEGVEDDGELNDKAKARKLFKLSCLGAGYLNLNKTLV